MTAFILAASGPVHRDGASLCAPANAALRSLYQRRMQVRPGHVIVYKLFMCSDCWTTTAWAAFMAVPRSVSA